MLRQEPLAHPFIEKSRSITPLSDGRNLPDILGQSGIIKDEEIFDDLNATFESQKNKKQKKSVPAAPTEK
jgi:hypothetical protein